MWISSTNLDNAGIDLDSDLNSDPLPSFSSGHFDWADDVEQELFSGSSNDCSNTNTNVNIDNTDINLDSNLNSDPLSSFPSSHFDWAEDVEQELFSGATDDFGNTVIKLDNVTSINPDSNLDSLDSLDSKPDIDPIFSPIIDQVAPEGVVVVGVGTTLCAIPEEGEEEDVTREDEVSDVDSIDLTDSDSDSDLTPRAHWTNIDSTSSNTASLDDTSLAPLDDSAPMDDSIPQIASNHLNASTPRPISIPPADTNTIVYRIIDVSTANNAFSLHMVEDDTASSSSKTNTSNSKTSPAQELYEAIQFLGTVGLLNLDTYATVFDTAARVCAGGPPFWLNDPLGDHEIVV